MIFLYCTFLLSFLPLNILPYPSLSFSIIYFLRRLIVFFLFLSVSLSFYTALFLIQLRYLLTLV